MTAQLAISIIDDDVCNESARNSETDTAAGESGANSTPKLSVVSNDDLPEISLTHPVYQETAITSRLPRSKRKIKPVAATPHNTQLRVVSDEETRQLTSQQLTAQHLPELGSTHAYDRTAFHTYTKTPLSRGHLVAAYQHDAAEHVPDNLPAADNFAGAILLQVIEILLGHRPARQLQTWLTPSIFDSLARRAELGAKIQGKCGKTLPPRIRKIHTCQISPNIVEISAVIFDGRKTRAAALRLEVRRQKWHVTALEII
ncbi:Rv3235 family protein [Arcanobacterium bovis]|uniref:Uncharacterized protein n=1 Tax=Arcanobacterium bovis TaxID=2529275 RepID=A0A4Q9UZR6_9ACTO|nr:Rv3235 family protein [Arcanobacterium bovis]TBW21533.1 hypothetical protein EZJ44_06250 [Arcanobacterium bovis]